MRKKFLVQIQKIVIGNKIKANESCSKLCDWIELYRLKEINRP